MQHNSVPVQVGVSRV